MTNLLFEHGLTCSHPAVPADIMSLAVTHPFAFSWWVKLINDKCSSFIWSFSSFDDHSKCFRVQFCHSTLHTHTHTHTHAHAHAHAHAHLYSASMCSTFSVTHQSHTAHTAVLGSLRFSVLPKDTSACGIWETRIKPEPQLPIIL